MGSIFLTKSSFQTVIAASMVFMFLNAFLPLNFSLRAEATKYPFKLTIILEKTSYKLGEPVNVTCILTNIGEENVTLYDNDTYAFLIRDKNFIHVYREGTRTLGYYSPLPPIAPGESWTSIRTWRQIYDQEFVKTEVGLMERQVPLGTYYVSGFFWGSHPTPRFLFETPVIRITIHEG